MIPDQLERERALDPSRSFIVQAPAGSGKTGLLVQRYLKLLSSVEKPESVIAMTFTRKAAAEMKERIHDALLAGSAEEDEKADEHTVCTRELARAVLAQDRRHGWNLLSDISRLQLETIDSLCAMLARQMPLVSGFAGSVEVIEDATELYRIAAGQTLRFLSEGSEELQQLLTRLGVYFDSDFNCLSDQIVRMLAQRDQWPFGGDHSASETQDFRLLLTAAEYLLDRVFAERGSVDFTAITQAAIKVLGSPEQPSDFLYGLDYRIQHLLVDEFQDTSLAQYKLINALTAQWSENDGHTLFLVGDPMQSIYRFRGAEVSLFLRTWNEQRLQSVRLHPIVLRTNFRSTPELVNWVGEQFQPMMSSESDHAVSFRPAQAARSASGTFPEWSALVGDDCAQEPFAVAELAQRAQKIGTVAILVRSRSHLTDILPVLRRSEIDYEAVEIDQLASRQHILDLVSLTKAILHVGDRTAWLACLRAPWCALDLADFSVLAENQRDCTILDLLSDDARISALSQHGRSNASRIREILFAAVNEAGRTPLRTLIENTWLLLGGPALLRDIHQIEDIQTCLSLLESLEDGGVIRDFTQLNNRLSCLFAKPATAQNSVQIMTIFKAKGLEFDTVILPRLEGITKTPERDLLIWDESSIAAQPRKGEKNDAYDEIRKRQQIKNDEELKRLLYVACTRAKNNLYLIGSVRPKRDGSLAQPRSGTFLSLLWPSAQLEFQSALRRAPAQLSLGFADDTPSTHESEPQTILRSFPEDWRLPRFSRWVKWQPGVKVTTASARKVTYEWVSDTGRHVGTVVHELLKRWSGHSLPDLEPVIKSELLRLGVPRSDENMAWERVSRAITNTLSSKRGKWILAPHSESRSELPIGGKLGDQLISGTVDRIFRDDDGRLWIIDFKTSEHQGARMQKFLDEEQRRYKPQLESYAALISRLESGPIWLGLYFPLLDAWREWQFEQEERLVSNYTG